MKNVVEVCKQFEFEAAHRLPYHDGKCKATHGHSYKVTLCFRGEMQQVVAGKEHTSAGMVVDFGDVKEAWAPVHAKFDHKSLNEFLVNPTAEHLVCYLRHYFLDTFPNAVLSRVRVHETSNSYAEWCLDWE